MQSSEGFFGDLDGVGLQFAQQSADVVGVAQDVNELFRFAVERDDERQHRAFNHAEFIGDGLEGEIKAFCGFAVLLQDIFFIQFAAF